MCSVYQRTVGLHVKKFLPTEKITFTCDGLKQTWKNSQRRKYGVCKKFITKLTDNFFTIIDLGTASFGNEYARGSSISIPAVTSLHLRSACRITHAFLPRSWLGDGITRDITTPPPWCWLGAMSLCKSTRSGAVIWEGGLGIACPKVTNHWYYRFCVYGGYRGNHQCCPR